MAGGTAFYSLVDPWGGSHVERRPLTASLTRGAGHAGCVETEQAFASVHILLG